MSTNQNTTQENLKKCSQKKSRISKFIIVITLIIVIASLLCVNAAALTIQNVTDEINSRLPYPSINMELYNGNSYHYFEISGAGKESVYDYVTIEGDFGEIECYTDDYDVYNDSIYRNRANYFSYAGNLTSLYREVPLNINLWAWTQNYRDSIIWQLWIYDWNIDTTPLMEKVYTVELPYFNNSAIMGTNPLEFNIEYEVTSGELINNEAHIYNLDLPSVEAIISNAIDALEEQSISEITFQYKGEELRNNNYVTDVYAEDGSKVTVDFKKALSTVLVQCIYYINGEVTNFQILNYNNADVNGEISEEREETFNQLVILNQFERSAEITIERQEKEVGLLNWLGNAISGIMNVEIFPNFSLGGILSVIIMIPVVIWILKLVAGG